MSTAKDATVVLPDFYNKYCVTCGIQRCSGVYDVVWREGCAHYQREIRKIVVGDRTKYTFCLVYTDGFNHRFEFKANNDADAWAEIGSSALRLLEDEIHGKLERIIRK